VLKLGDVVEVQVKDIRTHEGQSKITLSLKALSADPWNDLAVLAPVGRVLSGNVTRLADFGAFVRVAPGLEGLLHISELTGRPDHPSKVLAAGQSLLVVVKSADGAARKISLTLAPEGAGVGGTVNAPVMIVGAIVSTKVERIEPFGLFVQIDGTRGRGGRGLIPNAELGLPRGADVRKHYAEGAAVTAKVLEVGEGRLRLSVRAIGDDEERAAFEGYRGASARGAKATLGDLIKSRAKR
jgi:small subunit ribosomal protein S1